MRENRLPAGSARKRVKAMESYGDSYATTAELAALWRPLTAAETERAEALLPVISDSLRQEAINVGRDLDKMLSSGQVLPSVVKSVVVDVAARALMTPDNEAPMTQYSQTALGYTVQGTYLVPGGGLFIKRSELARLGLRRQRIGVIDLYDTGDNGYTSQP